MVTLIVSYPNFCCLNTKTSKTITLTGGVSCVHGIVP